MLSMAQTDGYDLIACGVGAWTVAYLLYEMAGWWKHRPVVIRDDDGQPVVMRRKE